MDIHIYYSKNRLNNVQTKSKGDINTSLRNYSFVYFDTMSVEGLQSKIYLNPQLCFTIKECKNHFSNNIRLDLSVRYACALFSVQNADNTYDCNSSMFIL